MFDRERALSLLRKAVGVPTAGFRSHQWEAIDQVVNHRQRLQLVQATGWGKSLVYFLATRALRDQGAGPTLLVSPLLALMRNQVEMAARAGIRAQTLNSTNRDDWPGIQSALAGNELDLLLVSPERLANEEFVKGTLLPIAATVGLLVVDEAHCISDWGHDFRPDYQRIRSILQVLPRGIPFLAVTATANQRVVDDIIRQVPDLVAVRGPLTRESLALQNVRFDDHASRLAWLASVLRVLPGSGIVYTLTVRDSERVARWLREQGHPVEAYHGELGAGREELEQRLLRNEVKALVATSALGMGFDKPDLAFVVHYQRPGSVVHYYQQVGRAGRAIPRALGILASGPDDRDIVDYFIRSAFPPRARVFSVLEALETAEDGLSLTDLEGKVNLSRGHLQDILKVLAVESPSPVMKVKTRWYRSAVAWSPDEEKIARLHDLRRQEQARMDDYSTTKGCLMAFLAAELDQPCAPCGRCSNCTGQPLVPVRGGHEDMEAALKFLRLLEVPIEPRRLWIGSAMERYRWSGRIPPELQPCEGRALCRWDDPRWGELVRRGKHSDGRFSDELLDASVQMLLQRWRPEPSPRWLTWVPSWRHPDLVPDLAKRLASRLGLPAFEALFLLRKTEPQKTRENSFHQLKNLDGALVARTAVSADELLQEPVLLVDDLVDSRWTFTVCSALLRQAGSGPVHPLALAQTTKGGE